MMQQTKHRWTSKLEAPEPPNADGTRERIDADTRPFPAETVAIVEDAPCTNALQSLSLSNERVQLPPVCREIL